MLSGILSNPFFWATLLTVLGWLAQLAFKAQASKREQEIAVAVYHAFHAASDFSSLEPQVKWLASVSSALKLIDDQLRQAGWRPLEPGEAASAAAKLQSLGAQAAMIAAKAVPAPASPK